MATGKPSFHCPNRNALYQVVKSEVGPETVGCEITCRSCGVPFPSLSSRTSCCGRPGVPKNANGSE
jgi:hypothetical protein